LRHIRAKTNNLDIFAIKKKKKIGFPVVQLILESQTNMEFPTKHFLIELGHSQFRSQSI
jgi:hypothetical protein